MRLVLTNKIYDILKWICLIGLPAVSVLVATLGEIWGVPNTDKIVLTINAIAVFLGALLGVSCAGYKEISHESETNFISSD